MERYETDQPGVVVYRGVPVVDVGDQRAPAYLHVEGSPRDQPSHIIRAYFGDDTVSSTSGREHRAFAAQGTTYNSPAPTGPTTPSVPGKPPDDPGDYDVMLDVSDAVDRLGSGNHTDVTLVLTDLHGRPLDASNFNFRSLKITRRR